ncbi:MAG: hypothetical protein K5985_08175 [Lachnospiraceae bacterium]|nr:hypothetical protein [Lachnospiraceae bacterium]
MNRGLTGIFIRTVKTTFSVLAAAVFMLSLSVSAYASDLDISAITEKKLAGIPTTEYEDCGVSAPALYNLTYSPDGIGYIIIGDSRTVFIECQFQVNARRDNIYILAASGEGFEYFEEIALPAAKRIEEAHPEIRTWRYIISMGFNDMWNIYEYRKALFELSRDRLVYFVSVNPVEDRPEIPEYGIMNKNLKVFNYVMMGEPYLKYIDTCSYLLENGYETAYDGIHYNGKTTADIYTLIKREILLSGL